MKCIIRVEFDRRELTKDLLSRLEAKIRDMSPVMKVVAGMMRTSVRENFRQGGRPAPWKPSRRAIEQDGKTLVHTHHLENSIKPSASAHEAEVGTNVIYAAVHHLGAGKGSFGIHDVTVGKHTRRITQAFGRPIEPKDVDVKSHTRRQALPWGDIPPRPFMLVPDEDMDEIRETALRYLRSDQ